jgi:Family of unknown function (DUF6141)
MNHEIVFQERQFLRTNPLTFMVWPAVFFICVIAFLQLIRGVEIGQKPAPDSVMIALWLVVGILIPLFFLTSHLSVTLTKQDICIKYFPFATQILPLSDIVRAEVRRSNALQEYGGWGSRFSPSYGRGYTIKGVEGVQLELRSGQKVFVGSASVSRLADYLHKQLAQGKT